MASLSLVALLRPFHVLARSRDGFFVVSCNLRTRPWCWHVFGTAKTVGITQGRTRSFFLALELSRNGKVVDNEQEPNKVFSDKDVVKSLPKNIIFDFSACVYRCPRRRALKKAVAPLLGTQRYFVFLRAPVIGMAFSLSLSIGIPASAITGNHNY